MTVNSAQDCAGRAPSRGSCREPVTRAACSVRDCGAALLCHFGRAPAVLLSFDVFQSFNATPGSVTNAVMCPHALHFT